MIYLFKNVRPAFAEINLDNLAYNVKNIKKLSGKSEMIGVVKADAYGHGAIDAAKTIIKNGVKRLAVAVITEAVELRKAGIKVPIMILGYTPLNFAQDIIDYDIQPTVFSYDYASKLSSIAVNQNKKVRIHIALDTGMGRIGFLPCDDSVNAVYEISKLPNIDIEGLFSHFSTADESDKEYSMQQFKKYQWFSDELNKKGVSIKIRDLSNSAAITDLPETHFDAVRPGIILYGYYPSKEVKMDKLPLKHVMTLKANIVHIKKLKKGEYISYGRKFKCERDSIIATLPIGYADGYTRRLGKDAKVIINDSFAPVVGRICMDQCMVDITDIDNVKVGDEVILMGKSEHCSMDAEDIANILGTISYEVLCMISKRIPRIYIKNDEIVKVRNYI